ncbi:MAG TPA: hypothetical protein VNA25_00800 [Phycisphaerae bacterium]|nr:hypothetical protein [Phycisphaerae bacterium]HUT56393.1 hypothetical protein [Phycisphaerae bacterium]
MRPIPKSRHLPAVVLLALASVAAGYFACLDRRVSEDQIRSLTAAIKHHDGSLYVHDFVFGPDAVWRFESPAYQTAIRWIFRLTGYDNDLMPVQILAGAVVMIYLCGMYALLYRQTRSWSVSVLMAILSSTVIHSLGGAFWGVGSLASITPAGLCVALTPLLVLAYMWRRDTGGLWAVFGWIGLMGNLHPASAMNLAIVLLILYLGQRRFSRRAWPAALGYAVVALVGSLPVLFYRHWTALQTAPAGAGVSTDVVRQALGLAEWNVLYPHVLDGVVTWLGLAAALLVIAAVILSRGARFRIRDFRLWVWCILGSLLVTFLFQGASQLLGMALGRPPLVVGFARASSLVMLPLYVLLAQAVTTLFRIARSHRALTRWALAALTAVWMVPSDNLRVARYAVADTVTMFMREESKPRYVRKHHAHHHEWSEMHNIAVWAGRNTPPAAVFITDRTEFRMYARRSILLASSDVAPLYRFTPWRLAEWTRVFTEQRKALTEAARSASALKDLVELLSRTERLRNVPQWYIIVRAGSDAAAHLKPVDGAGWGRYYQLCRVR